MNKGLIIFAGGSFRPDIHKCGIVGCDESYDEQIKACHSHIYFLEHIKSKYKLDSVNAYISTYSTKFNNDLLNIYIEYLIGYSLLDKPIDGGLDGFFQKTIHDILNINQYDFILFMRIDIFLKEYFIINNVFNPYADKIFFLNITYVHDCVALQKYPRVSDVLIFIPKKYYSIFLNNYVNYWHDTWYHLREQNLVSNDDIDVMVNTFHDSNTKKDYNPFYYIVNRPQTDKWCSEGYIFEKKQFFEMIGQPY